MALLDKVALTGDNDLTKVEMDLIIDEINNRFDKTIDTLDAILTGTTNKHFTATYESKLIGIEDGATADQTDAEIETAYNNQVPIVSQVDAEAGTSTTVYRWTPERVGQAIAALAGAGSQLTQEEVQDYAAPLLNHANHTGIAATYDDVNNRVDLSLVDEYIDDRVAALLVQGSNVTLTYDDVANTLTIAASSSGSLTQEEVQDFAAPLLNHANHTNITAVYDDANNRVDLTANIRTQEEIEDFSAALLTSGVHNGISVIYDDANNRVDLAILDEAIDDRVNALLVQGTNITLTYDDVANTLTIDSTDTNTQLTQEEVQDFAAPLLNHANHSNVSATYDDANNRVDLSLTGVTLLTGAQTIAGNKTFSNQANVSGNTVTFSATATFNLDNGNVQEMTLTGDITSLSLSNKANGGTYIIYLIQDATGGRAIPTPDSTFGTKTTNSADFTTAANGVNIITVNVRPGGTTYYSIETV